MSCCVELPQRFAVMRPSYSLPRPDGLAAEISCSAQAVVDWFDAIHRTPRHRKQRVHTEPVE